MPRLQATNWDVRSYGRGKWRFYSTPSDLSKDVSHFPIRSGTVTNYSSYADAITLLYSSNTFEFDSMESFVSFSCALLPQRFDTIRSVRLDLRFNLSLYFSESTCFNDWPRWERTWRILSTMGSLQRLWVRIVWPRVLYDQEERRFTHPLWILTRMKTFEVSLPPLKDKENNFRKYEEKEWGKEVPFLIVRRSTS